jgi:protocatechuate 3,4-dioxygenase alpha subunit
MPINLQTVWLSRSEFIALFFDRARAYAEVMTARTPGLLLGPFYPLHRPATPAARLWSGAGAPVGTRALRLCGRVLDLDGAAIALAWVELWHADPQGRYRHPSAPGHREVDVRFDGYGACRTDAQGAYAFDSLVPGAYVHDGVQRAPHLHVQVSAGANRLVTQCFLPGEPRNESDRWLRAVSRPHALLPVTRESDEHALHLEWDIVMDHAAQQGQAGENLP